MGDSSQPVVPTAVTPQDLLVTLRRHGPLTAEALAARIGLSRTATLHQLRLLAGQGLVDRIAIRHGVGRPHHLYDVTPGAATHLPSGYERLTRSLIDAALAVGGPELVARIFDARRRTLAAEVKARLVPHGVATPSLLERIQALAAFQDEQGYLAEVTDERGLRLRQRHCPILDVAAETPIACDAELRLFADVLAADVRRESNIATGARECSYRIRARSWDMPPVWSARQMRSPQDAVIETEPAAATWVSHQMRPDGVRNRR